jgi:hypothetical protein
MAKSEIEIEKLKAHAKIELEESLKERITEQIISKEIRKQANRDSVTNEAIKFLPESVSKEKVNQDWVFQFYEYAQNKSDEDIQTLWAKILAGEITKPNSFSLRTLQFVSMMSKEEAHLFDRFCSYVWTVKITDGLKSIYISTSDGDKFLAEKGLRFIEFSELKSLGLLLNTAGYYLSNEEYLALNYGKKEFLITSKNTGSQKFAFKMHPLTKTGEELLKLRHFKPDKEYVSILKKALYSEKFLLQEILDGKTAPYE